jgi:hypothetical protein
VAEGRNCWWLDPVANEPISAIGRYFSLRCTAQIFLFKANESCDERQAILTLEFVARPGQR